MASCWPRVNKQCKQELSVKSPGVSYWPWSTSDRKTPETAGKVPCNVIVDWCDWQSVLPSGYKKPLLWKLGGTSLHGCLTPCRSRGPEVATLCSGAKLPPRARDWLEACCVSPGLIAPSHWWGTMAGISWCVFISEWKTFPVTVCHSLGLLNRLNLIVSHCLDPFSLLISLELLLIF